MGYLVRRLFLKLYLYYGSIFLVGAPEEANIVKVVCENRTRYYIELQLAGAHRNKKIINYIYKVESS